MGGFGQAIKSRLLSKEAHLLIHFSQNPFLKKYSDKNTGSLFFDIEEQAVFSDLTKEQKKGIKTVVIFETQDLILKSSEGFKRVKAIGYSKKQWNQKVEQAVMGSRFHNFHLDKSQVNTNLKSKPSPLVQFQEKSVLLSYEISLETGLVAGDMLTLIPLAGLLLPPGLLPPIKQFKVKAVLPPAEAKREAVSMYYKQGLMSFGDFSKTNYKAQIQLKNPEQALYYQNLLNKYKIQNWMERNSFLFFALKLEKFMMTLFLTLALIISCLGVSSALFLLMTQKGEDLAILQAMGLSQKEMTKIFTKIGLYLSSIGLFAGAFIGFLGTIFLKYNRINILPEMYQDRTIPAVFMPSNYLIILIGAVLLSWLFCYLPARYLSRIQPAQLLKITPF